MPEHLSFCLLHELLHSLWRGLQQSSVSRESRAQKARSVCIAGVAVRRPLPRLRRRSYRVELSWPALPVRARESLPRDVWMAKFQPSVSRASDQAGSEQSLWPRRQAICWGGVAGPLPGCMSLQAACAAGRTPYVQLRDVAKLWSAGGCRQLAA